MDLALDKISKQFLVCQGFFVNFHGAVFSSFCIKMVDSKLLEGQEGFIMSVATYGAGINAREWCWI